MAVPSGGNSGSMASSDSQNATSQLSKQEQEVYDRQIRLWGMEAQNKLRSSSVLVAGLSGLGAEVVKNLMLCGIKSMTLVDDQKASEDDKVCNFLLEDEYEGKNRASSSAAKAQALNPMVPLTVQEVSVTSLGMNLYVLRLDKSTWSHYDLVIVCDQTYDVCERIDAECRDAHVRFIAGSVFGMSGYAFFDFDQHSFLVKQQKNMPDMVDMEVDGAPSAAQTLDEDVYEIQKLSYPSMKEAFNVDWTSKKLLRRATRLLPASYFPIRAMLRAQSRGALTGSEEEVTQTLYKYWRQEIEDCGQSAERATYTEEDMECFLGPQLSSVCAIVGGLLGQEAIKALSENEYPFQNLFLYSALDSAGIVCNYPPK